MALLGPPADIAPERLFRLLLRAPRARTTVTLPELGGVTAGAVYVLALSAAEEATAYDECTGAHEAVHLSVLGAELAALALYDEQGQLFQGGAELCSVLDEHEADQVINATLAMLARISPSFRTCDYDAWLAKLAIGAAHPSNMAQASALGSCADVAYGPKRMHTSPRPDRYFGVPLGQLTDGQWLVYRAARQSRDRDHG